MFHPEDFFVCERVQMGKPSDANTPGRALCRRGPHNAGFFGSLAKDFDSLVKYHRNVSYKKNQVDDSVNDIRLTAGECHHGGQDCGYQDE